MHDGGIRVPGLLVWPDGIDKPFATETPCVSSDYLPTILDIVGEDVTQWPHELDGTSLLPLIESGELDRGEPIGFAFGDQTAWIAEQYKLYSRAGEFELYDMSSDISEQKNLASEHPDIVADIARIMKEEHVDRKK